MKTSSRMSGSVGVLKKGPERAERPGCMRDGSAEMIVERKKIANGVVWLNKCLDCIRGRKKKSAEKRL